MQNTGQLSTQQRKNHQQTMLFAVFVPGWYFTIVAGPVCPRVPHDAIGRLNGYVTIEGAGWDDPKSEIRPDAWHLAATLCAKCRAESLCIRNPETTEQVFAFSPLGRFQCENDVAGVSRT